MIENKNVKTFFIKYLRILTLKKKKSFITYKNLQVKIYYKKINLLKIICKKLIYS
jgi:hypothetical protein